MQRGIVTQLAIMVILCGTPNFVFGSGIYVFGGEFSNYRIPADQTKSKGWMNTATINISQHHRIDDLDVKITVTHSNVFDLQIFLESPSGSRICLNMYDATTDFFKGADYAGTIFDDEAAISISDGTAPFSGSFQPMEGYSLSVFDDEDAFGRWKFDIYDAWAYDTGELESFEIMIRAPEPLSAVLFLIGSAIVFPRRVKTVNGF